MNLIFSADQNWGIGRENRLLFRSAEDMAFFRRMTNGKAVIMGRRTLDSLPGGNPLPNRTNFVLTRDMGFYREGVNVCHSKQELFDALAPYADEDLFVIGGEQIYRMLLPYCEYAYVTRWEAAAEADSHMTDLDHTDGWELLTRSPEYREKGLTFFFCTYRNQSVQAWR